MQSTISDYQANAVPTSFQVAVVMQSQPAMSQWAKDHWQAVGVVVTGEQSAKAHTPTQPVLLREQGQIRQFLYPGFEIVLHPDECESYYYNIISDNPRCYIIANETEDGPPEPFLVSMCFDEAHSYLEGEGEIYDVDVPPELYRWVEAYVVTHYIPEIRKKRKRDNWKDDGKKS